MIMTFLPIANLSVAEKKEKRKKVKKAAHQRVQEEVKKGADVLFTSHGPKD